MVIGVLRNKKNTAYTMNSQRKCDNRTNLSRSRGAVVALIALDTLGTKHS